MAEPSTPVLKAFPTSFLHLVEWVQHAVAVTASMAFEYQTSKNYPGATGWTDFPLSPKRLRKEVPFPVRGVPDYATGVVSENVFLQRNQHDFPPSKEETNGFMLS